MADTLDGQRGAAGGPGTLPNYKELELKRPSAAPIVLSGGLADYSRLAQMQLMMDEMARSNHLINDIGRGLQADAAQASAVHSGRYSGRLSHANRTAQSRAVPQKSKRSNVQEPGNQSQQNVASQSSKGASIGHGVDMADIQSKLSRLDEENSKFYDNLSRVEMANPSALQAPATRAHQQRRDTERSGSNRSRASPARSRRSLAPSTRSPQRVGLGRQDLQIHQSN